jgi:hypothetical protein
MHYCVFVPLTILVFGGLGRILAHRRWSFDHWFFGLELAVAALADSLAYAFELLQKGSPGPTWGFVFFLFASFLAFMVLVVFDLEPAKRRRGGDQTRLLVRGILSNALGFLLLAGFMHHFNHL